MRADRVQLERWAKERQQHQHVATPPSITYPFGQGSHNPISGTLSVQSPASASASARLASTTGNEGTGEAARPKAGRRPPRRPRRTWRECWRPRRALGCKLRPKEGARPREPRFASTSVYTDFADATQPEGRTGVLGASTQIRVPAAVRAARVAFDRLVLRFLRSVTASRCCTADLSDDPGTNGRTRMCRAPAQTRVPRAVRAASMSFDARVSGASRWIATCCAGDFQVRALRWGAG